MLIEPNKKYIPSLISLWNRVFGDSEEYIRLFFKKAYYDSECFAEINDGEIVSAFFLLKCKINYKGNSYCGRYLYAAATSAEYRGKGIMSSLIKEAVAYCESQKLDFIALVPADDGLYNFYKSFGFCQSMVKYKYTAEKSVSTLSAFGEITDSDEFIRIRNSSDCDMLIYSDVCNEYAFECLRFTETGVYALGDSAYYAEDEELFCSDSDTAMSLINSLCGKNEIYTNCALDGAEKIRNGMIYCFNNDIEFKDVYMNIALD